MFFIKEKDKDRYEKALSWFWILLFVGAVLYLRWLLVDIHIGTAQLSAEREHLYANIKYIQQENERISDDFQESMAESIKNINNLDIRLFQNILQEHMPP